MAALVLTALSAVAGPARAADDNVLRIATAAQGEASFSFQPTVCGSDQQNWETLLYVPPMYFDENSQLQPGVFKSWTPNDDRTVWIFEIDPRAKFSDGSPLTAEDVKGTWEIMANPQYCGRAPQYLGNVAGFDAAREANDINATIGGLEVVDERTLKVVLTESDPVFMYRIATTHLNPIKAADARALGEAEFWLPENKPRFTGPYVLSEYNPDLGQATMTPNPNWWMDEGPYLDAVKFLFVPDAQTAGVMVVSDQIDASQADIPPVFRSQAPGYFEHIKSIGYHAFFLRPNAAPTDDPLVRKALTLAVDWNAVAKATFADVDYLPTPQPLDPEMIQDPDNAGYPYDPEAAREALAASRYGGPDNLPKIRVSPRGNRPSNNRALQAVMGFWKENLGIENVEFQERPEGFGQDWKETINLTRDDVVIRYPDAASYMNAAATSTGVTATDTMNGYANPAIDALLSDALKLDPSDPRRDALAFEAQAMFMDDYVMLGFGKAIRSVNARAYVKGYFKGPDVALIAPWRIRIEK